LFEDAGQRASNTFGIKRRRGSRKGHVPKNVVTGFFGTRRLVLASDPAWVIDFRDSGRSVGSAGRVNICLFAFNRRWLQSKSPSGGLFGPIE
jgi:hypothetical protein